MFYDARILSTSIISFLTEHRRDGDEGSWLSGSHTCLNSVCYLFLSHVSSAGSFLLFLETFPM